MSALHRSAADLPYVADRSVLSFLTPPLILLSASLVSAAGGGFPSYLAPWPFVVAIFVIGLPHGANDLSVIRNLAGPSMATAAGLCCGYLTLMAVSTALLAFAPVIVLFSFGLLSAWHFGKADMNDLNELSSGETSLKKSNVLRSLARGLLILLLPFWLHFEESVAVFNSLLQFCGQFGFSSGSSPPLSVPLLVLACVTVEIYSVCRSLMIGNTWRATVQATEVVGLTAAFSLLHPLFAMGLYFVAWHSWRHLIRLSRVVYRDSTGSLRFTRIISLHRDSLILLIPTICVILALAWKMGGDVSPLSLSLASILVYVVVTLPHELLCRRVYDHLALKNVHGGSCRNSTDVRFAVRRDDSGVPFRTSSPY